MFVKAETYHNGELVHTAKAEAPACDTTVVCSSSGGAASESADLRNGGETSAAAPMATETEAKEKNGPLAVCLKKVHIEVNAFLTSEVNKEQGKTGSSLRDEDEDDGEEG